MPPQVEPDGERLVVAVSERDDPGSASPLRIASASLTTAPSTQPPLTMPATSPSTVDGHRRPGLARAGALDVDHAGDRHGLAGVAPAVDVVEQLAHQDLLVRDAGEITLASSSMAASE